MKSIFESYIDNELGRVSCEILSDCEFETKLSELSDSTVIKTNSHLCELVEIKLSNDWVPKGMSFEESKGWLWKIRKIGPAEEKLKLRCVLNPDVEVSSSPDTGENLDSIEIEGKSKVLHIGTEDPEALYYRAEKSDCMPNRLVNESETRYALIYTNYLEYGFETEIPELFENETIYFHYLYAINSIKQSSAHPDELDISTWFAVEQRKDFLMREYEGKFTANN